MTTFKKYLGYRLKSSLLQTVTFALIALVITVTTANEGVRYLEYGTKARTGIESLATIMCIVASIIPMLETDCFKNRRNLDTLYFLPLSRFKLAMVHYLSGIIQVFVIYTVAFLGHVIALLKYARYFRLQYMPLYYVLLLLLGIAIYSVFIFLFGEANSTTDGFICSVMWIFALYLVALVVIIPIREYAYYYVYGDNIKCFEFTRNLNNFTTWFIPYTSVNNLTVVFQHVMEGVTEFTEEIKNESGELATLHLWPTFADVIEEKYSQWYMFFLPVIAGAASVFGYFRDRKSTR
jgi:hypothetical protein